MWFGSDLQKSHFMCFFAVQTSINLDTIYMCQKTDLGWQPDQGQSGEYELAVRDALSATVEKP